MENEDNTSTPASRRASAAERRLRRLVVPAPASYDPRRRIDWVHDPDGPHGSADEAGH